jgi:hypothetical protein
MRRPIKIAVALLLVARAGATVWRVSSLWEPVYRGKRLSLWLERYPPDGDSPEVDEAVRRIGTNALKAIDPGAASETGVKRFANNAPA